jgi:hypothetical protein
MQTLKKGETGIIKDHLNLPEFNFFSLKPFRRLSSVCGYKSNVIFYLNIWDLKQSKFSCLFKS